MSTDEMRVKIAEECGWIRIPSVKGMSGMLRPCWEKGERWVTWPHELPNYPGDLNACHEMEKVLRGVRISIYLSRLADVIIRSGRRDIGSFDYLRATAPQRCEAFLRALNIWTD